MSIYVALGSNLGDRLGFLRRAVELLAERGVTVTRRSAIHESAPVGIDSERAFLNAVVEVETDASPELLLASLLAVERALGRRRDGGPCRDRTCDLDLLLFHDVRLDTPSLVLPHPRIAERRFVLAPLLELAADLRDPRTREPYAAAAARLASDGEQRCRIHRAADRWDD